MADCVLADLVLQIFTTNWSDFWEFLTVFCRFILCNSTHCFFNNQFDLHMLWPSGLSNPVISEVSSRLSDLDDTRSLSVVQPGYYIQQKAQTIYFFCPLNSEPPTARSRSTIEPQNVSVLDDAQIWGWRSRSKQHDISSPLEGPKALKSWNGKQWFWKCFCVQFLVRPSRQYSHTRWMREWEC